MERNKNKGKSRVREVVFAEVLTLSFRSQWEPLCCDPPRPTSCTLEKVLARCECQDYSPPGPSARGCHLLRPLVIIGATGLQSPLYGVEKPLRIRQVMRHAWHTADPCLHRRHGHYCFFITTVRARPTCHFWTLIPLHVPD